MIRKNLSLILAVSICLIVIIITSLPEKKSIYSYQSSNGDKTIEVFRLRNKSNLNYYNRAVLFWDVNKNKRNLVREMGVHKTEKIQEVLELNWDTDSLVILKSKLRNNEIKIDTIRLQL